MDGHNLAALIKWLYKNAQGQTAPYTFCAEEWYALYALALKHKVEAILYRLLCSQKLLLHTAPTPVRRAFRAAYQYNCHQNSLGVKEADKIVWSCSSAEISLCAERGLALLVELYPETGMRPMQDIDFIASIEDRSSIDEQLKHFGYEIARVNDLPAGTLPAGQNVDSVLYRKIGDYQDHNRQPTIDITYRIKNIELQRIIAESRPSTHGVSWRELRHEDFFLLLCHGLYEDTLEKDSTAKPEHCSIGKLIDLVGYGRIYPMLMTEQMRREPTVEFAQACADTFWGIRLFA